MIESNESINSIDTHKILATIPIMPYQNILCVGAEEGLFPVLFGKFVFDGKVIVFESDKKNIDKTKKILKKINLGNVELDNLTGNKISLKDKIDGIFISDWNLYKSKVKLFENNLNNNTWISILSDNDQSKDKILSKLKKDSEIHINQKYKLYNYRHYS
tara:strand:- start:1447 stop:1923 length:477 start_codon:yes stop_codon:yes gene_type:complete